MASRYLYTYEVRHEGLNKYRLVKGETEKIAKQKANNDRIDQLKKDFELGEASEIENYFEHSIEDIKLPFDLVLEVELEYQIETKMLIVDILLPTLDDLPVLKRSVLLKIETN